MLMVNDEHRLRAGMKSLSKCCSSCSKPLKKYPLIMNDDAGFQVFYVACAAALALDIQVDLCAFFCGRLAAKKMKAISAPGTIITRQSVASQSNRSYWCWLKWEKDKNRINTGRAQTTASQPALLLLLRSLSWGCWFI